MQARLLLVRRLEPEFLNLRQPFLAHIEQAGPAQATGSATVPPADPVATGHWNTRASEREVTAAVDALVPAGVDGAG